MSRHSRDAKIFAALLVSMTIVAIILMVLGKNPPSAGAFCLDTYYQLEPVEEVILSRAVQSPGRWKTIEIYYSGIRAGDTKHLESSSGLAGPKDVNCHFFICNGRVGSDGQIQSTENWQKQQPIISSGGLSASSATIRICIIADGVITLPTDLQMQRAKALIEALCGRFYIRPVSIRYPNNWR